MYVCNMKFYNPFKYKFYSYKEIEDKLDYYIAMLMNLQKTEQFDCILAIETGGLHTAAIMNRYLRLPLYTIIQKSYDHENKRNSVIQINNGFDFNSLKGKRVLIIDDLIDSGASIQYCIDRLSLRNIDHSFVTIFWAEKGLKNIKPTSNTKLFYTLKKNIKPNKWIVFPWETKI